jgi:hypothetical protein
VSVSAAADVATLPKCEQAEVAAGGEREILEAARTIRTKKAEQRRAERIDRPLATTKQNAPFPGGHRFNKAPRRTRLERELDAGAIHRLHVEQQRNSDLAEKLRAAETKIAGLESEVADLKAERDRLHQGLAEAHAANLALIERVKAHVSVEPPVTFGDPGPIPESLRRDRVRS